MSSLQLKEERYQLGLLSALTHGRRNTRGSEELWDGDRSTLRIETRSIPSLQSRQELLLCVIHKYIHRAEISNTTYVCEGSRSVYASEDQSRKSTEESVTKHVAASGLFISEPIIKLRTTRYQVKSSKKRTMVTETVGAAETGI